VVLVEDGVHAGRLGDDVIAGRDGDLPRGAAVARVRLVDGVVDEQVEPSWIPRRDELLRDMDRRVVDTRDERDIGRVVAIKFSTDRLKP
jgi:hypothetical protein